MDDPSVTITILCFRE